MKVLIQGGMVVTPRGSSQKDILVEDGKIARIGSGLPCGDAETLDASGCLLFPGFIDSHTHFDLSNDLAHSPDDFHTASGAALLGGTTSILDFATQNRGETLTQALNNWHRMADGKTSCDYGFHMSFSEWNPVLKAEVKEMAERGVTSFKLYMAYDNLRVNDGEMYEILQEIGKIGGIAGTHCENGDLVNALVREQKAMGHKSPAAHPLSRPDEVEAEAVSRYLRVAELAGVPVNIVHLSTKKALEEVRRARARGQDVYVETCPQYLLLDDSRYDAPFEEACKFVLSPPLRKPEDEEALWQALQNGEIDTVGTDHCSFHLAQKAKGRDDFSKIPNGIPGVQHRAQLIYTYGVEAGRITKEQMAALLSENIARQFGMYPQKGVLEAGSDADIVVWDPKARGTISAAGQAHNVDNTPYEGFATKGAARDVFLRGERVVDGGRLVLENRGRFVSRKQSEYFHREKKQG